MVEVLNPVLTFNRTACSVDVADLLYNNFKKLFIVSNISELAW
jgi:hypothetical protein